MSLSMKCRSLAVLCAVLAPMKVLAVPETFIFTGTVLDGGFDGRTVSGSLTIDPDLLHDTVYSDGATYLDAFGSGPTERRLIYGQFTMPGSLSFKLAFAPEAQNVGEIRIDRTDSLNHFSVNAVSYVIGFLRCQIILTTEDFLGPASTIFDSPRGDVDPTQVVNWFTPGSTNLGYFEVVGGGYATFGHFTLDSMIYGPIPEPSTYVLMLLGLVALVARGSSKGQRR